MIAIFNVSLGFLPTALAYICGTNNQQTMTQTQTAQTAQTQTQEPRLVGAFISEKPFTIHYVPEHVERLPDHVSFVSISEDGRAVAPAPAFKKGYGHAMFLTEENEIMAFAWRNCWHSLAVVVGPKTGRFSIDNSEETAHMADYFDCPEIIAEQFAASISEAPATMLAAGGGLFVRQNGTVTDEPWPTAKAAGMGLETPDARLSAYQTSRDYALLREHLDAGLSVVFSCLMAREYKGKKQRVEGVAVLKKDGYVFDIDKTIEEYEWLTIKTGCTQEQFAEKCESYQMVFIVPNQ